MRGLMFNYLLEYIESRHGYGVVDAIIEESELDNDGSYADGGMYKDADFIKLIATTSETLKIPTIQFLESFGKQTFSPLYKKFMTIYDHDVYKQNTISSAFDFIVMLNTIHYKEVTKLYPDSIFPHFDIINRNDSTLEVIYRSKRHLPFLAKGLLEGCIAYFDEVLIVEIQNDSKEKNTHFIIRKERA
ncbi:MAG: heme NO-binding domain-containing protein [Sulfurovum sp.]|nr:heme NO-binding domain-containing protein [Sulfurovum sp.]